MAKEEKFTFLSADGKTTIHAVKWIPEDGKYEAILQITHGMIEFVERYRPFAEFLTENGFMVVGHDHLGHGDSVASKDGWGFSFWIIVRSACMSAITVSLGFSAKYPQPSLDATESPCPERS